MKYEEFDSMAIKKVKKKVETDANLLNRVIEQIIRPYSASLDEYIQKITDILHDGKTPPSIQELEEFCLRLSTEIYWAGSICEQLGIRDDISKALYKEIYNNARDSQDKGTVADKNTYAELSSQQEYLTNVCYNRAYRIMKAKVENAQELLGSCKKALSNRMSERELTRIGG